MRTIWNGSISFGLVNIPVGMALAHGLFVLAALLMTLGVATRVTCVITLFAALNYIHRNTTVLFGADTMMTILLWYLAIGPSGAALSLDRWLGRWWQGRRASGGVAPAAPPEPSVSANVAIRLLQIHLCIIYGMAGLSKFLPACSDDGNDAVGITTYVYLMLENRTFDHVFGARKLQGMAGDGLTTSMANPNSAGTMIAPYEAPMNEECVADPPHGWDPSHRQWNNGAMDGFVTEYEADHGTPGLRDTMQYLTRWRLTVAAQRLRTESESLARIAADVGYDSEAAFNRAFKRELGATPAAWRRNGAVATSGAARYARG